MDRKALWLTVVLLLAAGCSSPAEQAKAAKFEQLYRDAHHTIEALEEGLTKAEETVGQAKQLLIQTRAELKQEKEARATEVADLKQSILLLQEELKEARRLAAKEESNEKPKEEKPKEESGK